MNNEPTPTDPGADDDVPDDQRIDAWAADASADASAGASADASADASAGASAGAAPDAVEFCGPPAPTPAAQHLAHLVTQAESELAPNLTGVDLFAALDRQTLAQEKLDRHRRGIPEAPATGPYPGTVWAQDGPPRSAAAGYSRRRR